MKTTGVVIGIICILIMIVGLVPCLGALNWVNIPLSVIGLVISLVAKDRQGEGASDGAVVAGIVMNAVALVIGVLRLLIGGGLL